ncbi:unnamed protein product [Musa banksii]
MFETKSNQVKALASTASGRGFLLASIAASYSCGTIRCARLSIAFRGVLFHKLEPLFVSGVDSMREADEVKELIEIASLLGLKMEGTMLQQLSLPGCFWKTVQLISKQRRKDVSCPYCGARFVLPLKGSSVLSTEADIKMMLDYEWGNPAAAAAAMLLFGEENGGHDGGQQHATLFDHFGGHGLGGSGFADFFPQPQPLTAAALFPPSPPSTCHQRYGMALPPLPARIGLNLGVRTYFSPAEEASVVVGRVCRRRTRIARCQAEGCGIDLTHAKHYHRRHKVCEFHSKASIAIVAGLSQRFCQQCSRFHALTEFDQGKRSCRKRLADHNRRRRKSQDLATSTVNQHNNNSSSDASADAKAPTSFTGCKPESDSPVAHMSPPQAQPLLPMPLTHTATTRTGLGLGCGSGVAGTGMALSSSAENSPPGAPFLVQLGEFRLYVLPGVQSAGMTLEATRVLPDKPEVNRKENGACSGDP